MQIDRALTPVVRVLTREDAVALAVFMAVLADDRDLVPAVDGVSLGAPLARAKTFCAEVDPARDPIETMLREAHIRP